MSKPGVESGRRKPMISCAALATVLIDPGAGSHEAYGLAIGTKAQFWLPRSVNCAITILLPYAGGGASKRGCLSGVTRVSMSG